MNKENDSQDALRHDKNSTSIIDNPPQTNNINTSELTPNLKKSRKKLWILLAIFIFILTLLSSAAAYAYYVYIPNTPESILKTASENFTKNTPSYVVEGSLDNGDPNSPDFSYKLEASTDGDWKADISSFVVAISPGAEVISKDGSVYVKPKGFLGKEELAEKYRNYSDSKSTIDYISDFTDYSDIYKWNDRWIEVPAFLFENRTMNSTANVNADNFNLENLSYEIGSEDAIDGRNIRHYTITLDQQNFEYLIKSLAGDMVASTFDEYANNNGFSKSITVDVTVDVDTKQFYSIAYDGRPFNDATFSFSAKQQEVVITAPEEATPLVEALSYGVAWSELIRPETQVGTTERDKERIADLKGIKLAFEIYKFKNDVYPDRYSIAVLQEEFLNENLPYVDHQLFIDPSGRRVGLNGSQYAYVPEQADSPEPCGELNYGPCEKFFLVTTLDDGSEYQINSGL